MRTIGDLLLNYKIPGVRHAEIRKICAEEITKLTGYPITNKQLQYKSECIQLTVPSVVRSTLLLRQQELLIAIAARGVTLKKVL